MQTYFIDNKKKRLILFFAGWGCDAHQFANLIDTHYDVLICYDYNDLSFDFDFTPYTDIYVVGYSAGVMIASILMPKIPNVRKTIAINGNPYLFDAQKGIPKDVLDVFQSITLDNYMDFRRQYMVMDEREFAQYNALESQRSLESCAAEYIALENIYNTHKSHLHTDFDCAIFSDTDTIFDLKTQKDFYKSKIHIIPNTKHHLFFKFNSFEEIILI